MVRPRRVITIAILLLTSVAAVGAVFAFYYWHALFNDNFHTVLPGELYRSAQLDGATLEQTAETYGLQSVLNLRGKEDAEWYRDEQKACARAGVELIDIKLDYFALPDRKTLIALCEVLADPSKRPSLLHCVVGSDRVGMPAALALIASGKDLNAAREQLSKRYGHFPTHADSPLGQILDLYTAWLKANDKRSSAENLLLWARTGYQIKLQ